jgi:hypothetical protein
MNAITVLPNMTVPPVARGQDYAFVARALHVDSGNPAGCDKIAHESKPLRSAAAADAVYFAIDRPVLGDRFRAVTTNLLRLWRHRRAPTPDDDWIEWEIDVIEAVIRRTNSAVHLAGIRRVAPYAWRPPCLP